MRLTIYIPTYRRPDIEACLASIMPQVVEGVEVIVSDNDGYAQHFCTKYPNLQYSKRHQNIDGDPNVFRGLSVGTGEYVWVIGDDDTLLPGTIETLLPLLDGTDRILHYSANAGETNPGFRGFTRDYITSLKDKSIIVAATLITSSVWRRAAMDLRIGLEKIDTRYPLAWAAIGLKTIKVMPIPTITVGHIYRDNVFPFFEKVISEYLQALCDRNEVPRIKFQDASHWNFVSVSQ
jgi:glycosyltransferase involved in cell wall biosynthesis